MDNPVQACEARGGRAGQMGNACSSPPAGGGLAGRRAPSAEDPGRDRLFTTALTPKPGLVMFYQGRHLVLLPWEEARARIPCILMQKAVLDQKDPPRKLVAGSAVHPEPPSRQLRESTATPGTEGETWPMGPPPQGCCAPCVAVMGSRWEPGAQLGFRGPPPPSCHRSHRLLLTVFFMRKLNRVAVLAPHRNSFS